MLSKYIPKNTTEIHAYIDYSGSTKKKGVREAVKQIVTTASNLDIPVAFTIMDTDFNTSRPLEVPRKYNGIHEAVNFIMDTIGNPKGPFYLQTAFSHINHDKCGCSIFVSDMELNIFPDENRPGMLYAFTTDDEPECIPKNPDSIWYLPINTFKSENALTQSLDKLRRYMDQYGIAINSHIMPTIDAA